jgi:conjugative transfer region lipoprotein (TIGR03751 family)
MKIQYNKLIVSLISIFSMIGLTGCSSLLSSKMPAGNITMRQAYNNAINGTDGDHDGDVLNGIRAKVIQLKQSAPNYNVYTRTQKNTINSQFPRLPNPSIVMYVYPHEAGSGYNITPVPGYSTVFPLYQHVYYAMPGDLSNENK